jgi:hypothetical protein
VLWVSGVVLFEMDMVHAPLLLFPATIALAVALNLGISFKIPP